jgi:hypothetical protein
MKLKYDLLSLQCSTVRSFVRERGRGKVEGRYEGKTEAPSLF